MKTKKNETCSENPVIEIQAVADVELVTVTGGRSYGWEGGGWDTSAPRESGFKSWSQSQPG